MRCHPIRRACACVITRVFKSRKERNATIICRKHPNVRQGTACTRHTHTHTALVYTRVRTYRIYGVTRMRVRVCSLYAFVRPACVVLRCFARPPMPFDSNGSGPARNRSCPRGCAAAATIIPCCRIMGTMLYGRFSIYDPPRTRPTQSIFALRIATRSLATTPGKRPSTAAVERSRARQAPSRGFRNVPANDC